MKPTLYMLECSDNSIYVGSTSNLEQRIAQHKHGSFPTCYTFSRRPLEVIWTQEFATMIEAISAERQIKRWSRAKKLALSRGSFAELRGLAVCKNETRSG
ncbi:MAG: GIY-YIG nuclease family protein [Candidatus Kapabacteria bacterium]|nr:GIY-YIG nuclease family protein [Candidatus Kapabacteria bacterium]